MEVLLLFIAELLAPVVVAWAIMAVQIVLLVLELLALVLEGVVSQLLGRKQQSLKPKQADQPATTTGPLAVVISKLRAVKPVAGHQTRFRKFAFWSGVVSFVLMAVTLMAIFVANLFFFEPIVRWQLAKIEDKTGIGVEFESADGSFWQGRVELANATVKRPNHDISQLDLTADEMTFDVSVLNLMQGVAIVEEASVVGLRGVYERIGMPREFKPKKPFKTQLLSIADANVTLIDRSRNEPITAVVKIASLKSEPFRSNFAVFDVMFRSNLQGEFAGAPISIVTDRDHEQRTTRWKFQRLPIELAAGYVGGPLKWVSHGELDINGTDHWNDSASEVEMDYEIVLHDIKAVVPPGTSMLAKVVAVPTVALLNKYPKRLPLSFHLKQNEKDFEFTASPLASRLGRDIGRSINDQIIDKLEDKKDGLKNKLKTFFDFGDEK